MAGTIVGIVALVAITVVALVVNIKVSEIVGSHIKSSEM